MLQIDQNWELFGYDPMKVFGYWRSAWRDFLWGNDSPVRARLDEVVRVKAPEGIVFYQSGLVTAATEATCEAIMLPDAMVLSKVLSMPLAVESDLDEVMAMEVSAHSPFPAADTGYGWCLVERSDSHLEVCLAIVSLSAAMAYLGREYDCHDMLAYEVWASRGDSIIELVGFGGQKRRERYSRRLLRMGAFLAASALCFVAVFGVAAGAKYLELGRYQEISASAKNEAAAAVEMRNGLAAANETILVVNQILATHPSPHSELARLTHLLGDDASLAQFSLSEGVLRIRGSAKDAAAVMAQLTDVPAYKKVSAPRAISKMGNTGYEQFYLDIRIKDGVVQ